MQLKNRFCKEYVNESNNLHLTEGRFVVRTKTLNKAKLVVRVESNKQTHKIKTVSVFDNRTQEHWSEERIKERGIEWFLHIDDMKETLNWNLNGDSSKYQFKWGQSGKEISEGIACVFE